MGGGLVYSSQMSLHCKSLKIQKNVVCNMLIAQETRQLIFQKLCTVTKTSALRRALKPRAGQHGLKEKTILRLSDQQYPAVSCILPSDLKLVLLPMAASFLPLRHSLLDRQFRIAKSVVLTWKCIKVSAASFNHIYLEYLPESCGHWFCSLASIKVQSIV